MRNVLCSISKKKKKRRGRGVKKKNKNNKTNKQIACGFSLLRKCSTGNIVLRCQQLREKGA